MNQTQVMGRNHVVQALLQKSEAEQQKITFTQWVIEFLERKEKK